MVLKKKKKKSLLTVIPSTNKRQLQFLQLILFINLKQYLELCEQFLYILLCNWAFYLHIIYVACVRKVALPWWSKASSSSTSKARRTCRALVPCTCPLFLIKKQNDPFIPSLMNTHRVHKTSLVKFSTIGPTFFLMTLTKFTYHVHKTRIFSLFINVIYVIYFVEFLLHF